MNTHARLSFLLDPELKHGFTEACRARGDNPSQVLRALIELHLQRGRPARSAPRPLQRPR